MVGFTAHHVGLAVSDLERELEFYRETLGLNLITRFSVGGDAFARGTDIDDARADFAHLDANGIRLELVSFDSTEPTPDEPELNQQGATHLGLAVDDVEAYYEALPADVETLSEPQTTESGTTVCFLRDPEGNLVEILSG